MSMLEAALAYAERGWCVFPCVARSKKPATRHGFKDATRDRAQITAWWTAHPDRNVAIACGEVSGGLAVVDIDVKGGADGFASLGLFELEHGQFLPTLTIATPSGGKHRYYLAPGLRSRGGWLPGVDVQSDGKYVLAPPSVLDHGAYRIVDGEHVNSIPPDMAEHINAPAPATRASLPPAERTLPAPTDHARGSSTAYGRKALDAETAHVRAAAQGAREQTLVRAAWKLGQLVPHEVAESDMREHLTAAAVACGLDTDRDVGLDGIADRITRAVRDAAKAQRQPAARSTGWDTALRGALRAVGDSPEEIEAEHARLAHVTQQLALSRYPEWLPAECLDHKGELITHLHALRVALAACPDLADSLRWDLRSGGPVVEHELPWLLPGDPAPRALADIDYAECRAWLCRVLDHQWPRDAVIDAMTMTARARTTDRVRDYLDALAWDQVPRLGRWLHDIMGAPNTDYARDVGRMWMISAVARTYQPGCQADHMLVLEGSQGVGKSRALRALFGDANIRKFPADLARHDAAQSIQGAWLVEADEFASLSKAEVAAAKAWITQVDDQFRRPYGREFEVRKRRCIFAATINPAAGGYLRDTTGNRRYWPIEVTDIEHDLLARDRDQLWAEAVARYRAGEKWWTEDSAATARLEEEQAERETEDPWAELLIPWLATRSEVTVGDCLEHLKIDPSRRMGHDSTRVASILRAAGRVARRRRDGSTRSRVWCVGES